MSSKFEPGNRTQYVLSNDSPGVSPLPTIPCTEAVERAKVPVGELELDAVFLLSFHMTEDEHEHLPDCPYQEREVLHPQIKDRLDELLPDE